MKTVSPGQDHTGIEELRAAELALPPRVQAALGGVGQRCEGRAGCSR
jgi:hypothetical protein